LVALVLIPVGATATGFTITATLAHELTPHGRASQRAKYCVDVLGAGIISGVPEPTNAPPHAPEYHLRVTPEPPEALSVIIGKSPWQKVPWSTATPVGATGSTFTVTVTLAQVALTHVVVVLRARAKYVVVVVGLTVGLAPPGTGVPPQETVNQSTVWPEGTVALRVVESPLQMVLEAVEDVAPVGAAGSGLTVTVTLAHVALTQVVVVFRARAK
jgi:hypothetical protein